MKRNAGFSLVELIVVASILCIALGVPLMVFRSAARMRSSVTTRVELQALARETVDRIADRLAGSGPAVIPQAALGPGLWSSTVDFRVANGWNGAAVVWRPAERIAFVPSPGDPDDGVDNDSDGLIDEHDVVWTTDVGLASQRSLTLCHDVPERMAGELAANNNLDDNGNGLKDEAGLSFEFQGGQVVIRLSLQGRDRSEQLLQHSEERRIAFRN